VSRTRNTSVRQERWLSRMSADTQAPGDVPFAKTDSGNKVLRLMLDSANARRVPTPAVRSVLAGPAGAGTDTGMQELRIPVIAVVAAVPDPRTSASTRWKDPPTCHDAVAPLVAPGCDQARRSATTPAAQATTGRVTCRSDTHRARNISKEKVQSGLAIGGLIA
jgi:hypothetical protein